MSETQRCAHCSGVSPADSRFCIECGAELGAATGPTVRLPAPRQEVYPRPAPPAFEPLRPLPARPLPPPPPSPARPAAPDLTAPLLIIVAALAFLLVPRMGMMALVWIGLGGLVLKSVLARPGRVMPAALLLGAVSLMIFGAKAVMPVLLLILGLRALAGPRW